MPAGGVKGVMVLGGVALRLPLAPSRRANHGSAMNSAPAESR